jgi:hypothetical protein
MSSLEDRYRRLLAWYPRDHRAAHEDEMVGVLLAGAEPGQTRPGLGDRADLLWGGLKLHTRRAFGRASAPAWRDALAVAGVVGTLTLLVQAVTSSAIASVAGYWVTARFVDVLLALILAAGVVTNQRWLAAPVAWLLMLNQLPWIGWDNTGSAGPFVIDGWMLLGVCTAVVLTLTGSPQRGLQLTGPRRLLPWAGLLAAVTVWEGGLSWFGKAPDPTFAALPMVFTCAIACGYALSSSLGRRCLAILALPVAYGLANSELQLFQTRGWLVAVLLGVVVVPFIVARRDISRRHHNPGESSLASAGG